MEPVMTPLELLLDDDAMMDEAGSHAAPAPRHSLMVHFEDELRGYESACRHGIRTKRHMALGGMRRIYWLALGQGETTIATYIANWWAEHHNEHGLGVLIV